MNTWKKLTLIIAAIVAVALLTVGLIQSYKNQNASEKDNRVTLERLDSISKRLSDIWLELEKIDAEIAEKEYQKDNLISEQTKLNDEASALFLNLVTPEFVQSIEEIEWCDWIGCDPNEDEEWQPGQLTEDGTNQVMPETNWDTAHERFKQIAYAYWLDPSKIWEVENHYGITEGVVLCITIAETSWGKFGAGTANIWNVWNNDRGDRVNFALADTGLEKIWQTLTNQYLWGHNTLWCLSNWHHCEEPTDNGKRYATSSPETSWAWEPNMVACLWQIYGENINPATFNIRNR